MAKRVWLLIALVTIFASFSWGFPFNLQKELDWADKYADSIHFHDNWGEYNWDEPNGECGHFGMRAIAEAAPELALYMKWKGRFNDKCNVADATYNDSLPHLGRAINWLRDHAGWSVVDNPIIRTPGDPPSEKLDEIRDWLEPGDIVVLAPWDESQGHAGIIRDKPPDSDSVGWRDHNGVGRKEFFGGSFKNYWDNTPDYDTFTLTVVRPKNSPNTQVLSLMALDSTWYPTYGQPYRGHGGYKFNLWKCCWHENIGGTWPWYSDSTGYACLSWTENSGTTIDSLISPRINLAGCSGAVFMQNSICDLDDDHGKVVQILLTTDDGATWDTINTGKTQPQTIPIPAADDKRDVRIAWVYEGIVQEGRSWCVDDVEIWASPIRQRDIAVNGIAYPCGTITQGIPVLPRAYVWNHGKQVETLDVTMHIFDSTTSTRSYTDTKSLHLEPYADTLLQFDYWTAQTGVYFDTCYSSAGSDECRANDTAALKFRVVADSWEKVSPVYGGHKLKNGSCLTSDDTDNVYCVPGKAKFFARFNVTQNIWTNLAPTIKKFRAGAGLAFPYPGVGDTIYALRGRWFFDCYSFDDSSWSRLNPTPGKVSNGGSLVWAGDSFLYALRGGGWRCFYRYNINSGTWDTLRWTPAKVRAGGSLVWTGGDSLFALLGNGTRGFYRYQISTDSWATRESTPVDVRAGGALAYYPQGNKIYAFFGHKHRDFCAYDVPNHVWLTRDTAPNKVDDGACLAYCNYTIYGGPGKRDYYFYRYAPAVGGFFAGGRPVAEPDLESNARSATAAGEPGNLLTPEELLTYDPSDKCAPRFSPDGLWIVYTACDTTGEGYGLYRIRVGSALSETLGIDTANYEDPRWSNSHAWLVVATDDGIYKVASGAIPVQLATGCVAGPHVTANDSWVLYEKWDQTAHVHHVYKVRPDGTGDACLTPGTLEYLEPVPVSDTEFACVRPKDGVYQLAKRAPGQEGWLTSDYMHNVSLDVSPDCQWLTYEKLDESGFWQVYKLRVDGTGESRVTDGTCDCETPVFSPNGQYIAYTKWPADSTGSSEFSQVCYKDVINPSVEVAVNSANAERENPCWSPDCQYIIYEITDESGTLGPNPKKQKQIGRARTRIKALSGVEELSRLPRAFALYQNRPNPFGRATTIRYALPVPSLTELDIFDATGRAVTRLVQSEQKPGYYSVAWNGKDMRGRSVAAGTYFYVLKSNGKIAQKRMLLVR